MSNLLQSSNKPRILFFGMLGRFSYAPLCALLNSCIEVCAVVIPSKQSSDVKLPAIKKLEYHTVSNSMLPVLNSSMNSSILDLAFEHNVPVWKVRQLSNPDTLRVLSVYQPDIICVACFSMRIPDDILHLPRLACLNVHPSLLPANRGPEPLFWTFREGGKRTGVTIHVMDEGLDRGAIVKQEAFEIPDGIKYYELEQLAANLAGKLLTQCVWDLFNGVADPVKQDESQSSYHPYPGENDFMIPVAEWDAKHVYNFMCGVESWGTPIYLLIENETMQIKKPISYSLRAIDSNEQEISAHSNAHIWVRCRQGSVLVEKA